MRTFIAFAVSLTALVACDHHRKPKEQPPGPGSADVMLDVSRGELTGKVEAKQSADDQLIAEAKQWIKDADPKLRELEVNASVAEWTNETDITKDHEAAAAKTNEAQSVGITAMVKAARRFAPILAKLDPDTRRQLLLLTFQAQPSPDDPQQATALAEIAEQMTSIYGKGVCTHKPGTSKEACINVDPYSKTLATSHDPAALLKAWQTWHDGVGRAERDLFVKFVALSNVGARAIGFHDVAELWKSNYDMPPDAFAADVDRLWQQVEPLYKDLHCYARRVLNQKYGDAVVPKTGPIPAHLLGNMWAQSWEYLYPDLEPFKGVAPIDVTPVLARSYDPIKMVKMGEAFYTSLGFDPLPATFWTSSQFVKPKGKDVVCHASAWDVQFDDDLRIKMCIEPNQENLWVIHHELGHDFYYQHYYQLPILYQAGANDGFHEAIGDTIQLSMTPEYLEKKGLLDKVEKNDQAQINQQMKVALEKIAFLPFGLLVDKWRWDVFSGAVQPDQYNQHWWDLRRQYQGIAPPTARAATDFDPGALCDVA